MMMNIKGVVIRVEEAGDQGVRHTCIQASMWLFSKCMPWGKSFGLCDCCLPCEMRSLSLPRASTE